MKLWKKVSIISILVLLLVVITSSVLLLYFAKDSILQLTIESAQAEQKNLRVSFSEMINYYFKEETNPVVQASAVKYCFSSFANETSVLVYNDETLYSAINIKPEEILPLTSDDDQQLFLNEVNGRNILIIGNNISIFSNEYSVYVVKDVTTVYNSIAAIVWRFILICGISVIIGILLIILLVRRASRPLIKLKEITRRIAVGEYGKRVEINSRDEVGELATDFNTMADAVQSHIAHLEDTSQRQQLFISGLTHEFKTPMTSMMIHTDTLMTTNLNEAEAKNSLQHIHSQCRWLERLTKKMLQLITLEEEIHVQEESVGTLFEDVYESTLDTLKERDTPLVIECSTDTLEFDFDLMKSLLINLVDNASKASDAGQSITLQAYDNIIEVVDCGKGIPTDEIARVTDAFYMVDRSRSKKMGGSGLGLALVKKIADATGVQLMIESEVNSGTVARIIFSDNKTFTS